MSSMLTLQVHMYTHEHIHAKLPTTAFRGTSHGRTRRERRTQREIKFDIGSSCSLQPHQLVGSACSLQLSLCEPSWGFGRSKGIYISRSQRISYKYFSMSFLDVFLLSCENSAEQSFLPGHLGSLPPSSRANSDDCFDIWKSASSANQNPVEKTRSKTDMTSGLQWRRKKGWWIWWEYLCWGSRFTRRRLVWWTRYSPYHRNEQCGTHPMKVYRNKGENYNVGHWDK